jgi:membrane protease YdiL (CAAX protease family)
LWWSTHGGDLELLAVIAMCVPGGVGLVLSWAMRREGPSAARVGLGSIAAWPIAFLAPPLMAAAIALLAARLGALVRTADYWIDLPYVGAATGLRVLAKVLLFMFILHGTYVLPAVVEDRTERIRALPRGALRVATWTIPMVVGHIAGDFGEELGWRGFLVRRWEDRPRVAVVLSSVAWSLFHTPWAVDIARTSGTPRALLFLVGIALLGVPMAALYRWGRSVWPCAIAHGGFDMWTSMLLGNTVTLSLPTYSHVTGGNFGVTGVAVFALIAVVAWPFATRLGSAAVPMPARP